MAAFSWWTLADEQFVVSIITIVYYFWILSLMHTSTSTVFRSAFYRIFIVTGFFDIQGIIIVEWIRIDNRFGLGPDYEVASRIVYSCSFSHFFIHIFGCFLMTINRYMAVCHPIPYEKCWTPRAVRLILLVVVFLSFIVHTELFFIDIAYKWEDNRWIYAGRPKPIPFFRIMCASVVTIYEFSNIILTALTLYSITMSGKYMERQKFRREVGLVIAMTIECLLGAVECTYEAVLAFHAEKTSNLFLEWIRKNFAIFLFVVFSMNSYGIIFMSSDLRKEVVRFCQRIFEILQFCGIKTPEKHAAAFTTTSSRCRDSNSTSRIHNNRVCVS